jgi:hypothetical protein
MEVTKLRRRAVLICFCLLCLAALIIAWGWSPDNNTGSETTGTTPMQQVSVFAGAGTSASVPATTTSQLDGPPASPKSSEPSIAPAKGSYALIYDGPVAAKGATAAVEAVAQQDGLPVKFVSNIQDLPGLLPDAKVFIIGGTQDDLSPLVAAFTPEITAAVKNYLQNGGRYLGICGGGFMASTSWDENGRHFTPLGIIPAASGAFLQESDPQILPIDWLGETRQMYYQAGPVFYMEPTAEHTRIIAHYADGRVAAFISSYGHGEVAVSGPHPEAGPSWIYNTANGDSWTSSVPLAVNLLQELLKQSP